ncbi:hypothetical protein [Falsiroseomonas selenitidurans]|uniref:DUF2946 domain-containing protein n=1 Tax=Falsiroseomonas selenitidurans TaxID=2716335 RepID=A0ABX1E318_9PROT|nr:hypothetical protein [Falsiroseomonas selenitidurans]NKC31579.1 hypothetical protein [Falsiroseomonas selenitidurans]
MIPRRRTLLACLPAALAAAPARAFRLEVPAAAVASDYGAAACPAPGDHAALAADLAGLPPAAPLPPELQGRLLALARCPFCGCALAAGAADHGEAAPAPEG